MKKPKGKFHQLQRKAYVKEGILTQELIWIRQTILSRFGHSMNGVWVIFYLLFFIGCSTIYERQRAKYDTLGSAVASASYAIIGEYGDEMPSDLPVIFWTIIQGNVSEKYLNLMKKYSIEIIPKGSYYLLIATDPETKEVILFDYSCTANPDGMILIEKDKYDLNNFEIYDPCKNQN